MLQAVKPERYTCMPNSYNEWWETNDLVQHEMHNNTIFVAGRNNGVQTHLKCKANEVCCNAAALCPKGEERWSKEKIHQIGYVVPVGSIEFDETDKTWNNFIDVSGDESFHRLSGFIDERLKRLLCYFVGNINGFVEDVSPHWRDKNHYWGLAVFRLLPFNSDHLYLMRRRKNQQQGKRKIESQIIKTYLRCNRIMRKRAQMQAHYGLWM